MPGLGSSTTDSAVTPGRRTVIEFDIEETQLLRPAWAQPRGARQITPDLKAGTTNVWRLPSGLWTLRPVFFNGTERQAFQDCVVRAAHFQLAPGHTEAPLYRAPSDLVGVTPAPEVVASGDYFILKRVPAGETWLRDLPADSASYPILSVGQPNVPLDRVAVSKIMFPANTGFLLRLIIERRASEIHDAIFRFYFGGPVDTRPPGKTAGEFALTLFGNGLAMLHERRDGGWEQASDPLWILPSLPEGAAMHVGIILVPIGTQTIDVLGAMVDEMPFGGVIGLLATASMNIIRLRVGSGPTSFTIQTGRPETAYQAKSSMTGPGPVRVDVRRDLRLAWQVSVIGYPQTGTLVDSPFYIPFTVLSTTRISLTTLAYQPGTTQIAGALYHAEDRTALTEVQPGTFAAIANHSDYYAAFSLTSEQTNVPVTGVRTRAPFLAGYEAWSGSLTQERFTTPIRGGNLRQVNITGPDLTPDNESAHVEIEDPRDQLQILRRRGRISARIYVDLGAGQQVTLFRGEVMRANAERRGKTGKTYPNPNYHRYSVDLLGPAARLQTQRAFILRMFNEDPNADPDPVTGTRPPWKITSIIKWLFEHVGIRSQDIDVPDLPIRAYFSGNDPKEFLLQPTASIYEFLVALARDYLGAVLLFDPNAGDRGKWKLLIPPQPPYTPVFHFVTTHPGARKLPQKLSSYPANTAFIETMQSWVSPPEANYIVVTATGQLPLPHQVGDRRYTVQFVNPKSFDFNPSIPTADPNHPDYLGFFAPIIYYDSALGGGDAEATMNALQFVGRRLAERTFHAERWLQWTAPLVFIPHEEGAGKRRPLRIYDAVTVDGQTVLVRSVNPAYEHDVVQMATYQGLRV